LDGEDR